MYMIPIRLWSVVVIQLVQPLGARSARLVLSWGIGAVYVVAIWCAGLLDLLGVLDLSGADLPAQLRPFRLRRRIGLRDQPLLIRQPGVELGRWDRPDRGDHARVAAAAEHGALPPVNARLSDLEPGVVVVAR